MRIRRKSSLISASPSSYSSSSPTSASSNSSSLITTNSLTSSIDSSSNSSTPPNLSPFSSTSTTSSNSKRCQGLDLLVKAIHLVTAGSVVGVPYIQRRIVRKRRAVKFNGLILNRFKFFRQESGQEEMKNQLQSKTRSMSRRQSKELGIPSEYQDSVIQPWMPKNRRQRSIKIGDKMCS